MGKTPKEPEIYPPGSGIKVLVEGPAAPRIDSGMLVLTLEADSPEQAQSTEARKAVYDARVNHGFVNAGIDSISPAYPVNPKGEPTELDRTLSGRYRVEVRFRPRA
jgi:hypothetical protein